MPLLEVKKLKTWFLLKGSIFREKKYVKALDGVNFTVNKGETVGLVGESGCGKSTLGRTLVRLEKQKSGEVLINGKEITKLKGNKLRKARSEFQMIFQDPYGSLNPRMNVFQILDEVLYLHKKINRKKRYNRIIELIQMVGLKEEHLKRYPHQFSGGQRQRIGIARALAVEPGFIVADEPVSALDVSVQAQIINLLIEIQKKTMISILFIAHDLAVVEHISNRILVMYLGKIVESGNSKDICTNPKHPYTQALLSAVPTLDKETRRKRIILPGDVPSPLNPPPGCPFHPRCPQAMDKCKSDIPEFKKVKEHQGHKASCWLIE